MADNLAAIASLLSCPDDGGSLRHASGEFLCSSCTRRFPIYADNLAEILPRRPCDVSASANPACHEGYLRAFEEGYRYDEASLAWGAEESVSESWSRKRRRQVAVVQPLITEGSTPSESVLCDIAAGAGYYTLAYAHRFRFVLHCDLSVDNLSYAWRKARARGIQNIFFLRSDYFTPPFRQSLHRILCLDTLIRGEAHDSILLAAIVRSLRPAGRAVVDFHNWWHNLIRRLGLLPDNFRNNRSYYRSEVQQLLRSCGIRDFCLRPFLQEFDPDAVGIGLLSKILLSTRLIYRFAPPPTEASHAVVARAAGGSP
jgi:SAM-dependent methyltransferase